MKFTSNWRIEGRPKEERRGEKKVWRIQGESHVCFYEERRPNSHAAAAIQRPFPPTPLCKNDTHCGLCHGMAGRRGGREGERKGLTEGSGDLHMQREMR